MRARRCVPFGPDVGDYAGVLTPEHDTNQGSSSARQARQRLPSHILLQRPGDEWIPLRENSFSMPLEPFQSGPLPLMVSALFVLLVGTKPDLHSSSPPAALNVSQPPVTSTTRASSGVSGRIIASASVGAHLPAPPSRPEASSRRPRRTVAAPSRSILLRHSEVAAVVRREGISRTIVTPLLTPVAIGYH